MDEKKIRVLLVEDNPGDAGLVREYLREASPTLYELEWVERVNKALDRMRQGQVYHVVLLDLTLPDSSGFESFEKIYEFNPDLPVIILTSLEDQELAFKALRQGAQDYFFKGHADSYSLHRSISFAIERKKFAQELLEKETRLRLLTSQFPALLWTTDHDLKLTSVLGAALKTINVAPNDVVAMPLTTFFRDNNDYAPINASHRALAGETASFELEWGKATFHAYVEPFHDLRKNIVGTIGVALDITEWKRVAEDLVRRSEEKYSRLFRHSNDGIFIYDLEGHVLDVNLKGMNLLGFSKPEIFALNLVDFHPPEAHEAFRAAMKKVDQHGFVNYEIPFRKRNGKLFPAEVSASAIELSNKKVVQGIVRDITERKKAEDRLKRANDELRKLNQLKTDFVSTVSHEFRTPLTIIVQANEMLAAEAFGKVSDEQRFWLVRIDENTTRLNRLLNEILDLSKLQSGRVDMTRELIDLGELVRGRVSSLELLAANKGIEMLLSITEPLPKVWANPSRVEQVLNNLIENAMKFTPTGGQIHVQVVQDQDTVRVSVKDTGPGIRLENLDLIFDRFAQESSDNNAEKSKSGIGLGLAISKEIIVQHQGRIWAESTLGQGSTFFFTLPITSRAPERRAKTVLVIDDHEETCNEIDVALTGAGYRVLCSRNGDAAIQLVREQGAEVDLVVIEVPFPGSSGFDVARVTRQLHPDIPMLIMTAFANQPALFDSSGIKPTAAIPKPLKMDRFLEVVRQHVPLPEQDLV
jgi:PAS domain S-box-containing protein